MKSKKKLIFILNSGIEVIRKSSDEDSDDKVSTQQQPQVTVKTILKPLKQKKTTHFDNDNNSEHET